MVTKFFFLSIILTLLIGQTICGQTLQQQYKIACHNCYEPSQTDSLEKVLSFTTVIELDLWDTRRWFGIGGWKAMNSDWYVRHEGDQTGNINCCGGGFSDCIKRLRAWSDNNLGHPLIVVFIDKKENWSEGDETRRPQELDQLLLSMLTPSRIFSATQLLASYGSLREAVLQKGWPRVDSLIGKFMFVLTDGTFFTSRKPLLEYVSIRGREALCFVAPLVTNMEQVRLPTNFSAETATGVVVFNLDFSNVDLVDQLSDLPFLKRVYGSPENKETVKNLLTRKVNFVAIDNFKLSVDQ